MHTNKIARIEKFEKSIKHTEQLFLQGLITAGKDNTVRVDIKISKGWFLDRGLKAELVETISKEFETHQQASLFVDELSKDYMSIVGDLC